MMSLTLDYSVQMDSLKFHLALQVCENSHSVAAVEEVEAETLVLVRVVDLVRNQLPKMFSSVEEDKVQLPCTLRPCIVKSKVKALSSSKSSTSNPAKRVVNNLITFQRKMLP